MFSHWFLIVSPEGWLFTQYTWFVVCRTDILDVQFCLHPVYISPSVCLLPYACCFPPHARLTFSPDLSYSLLILSDLYSCQTLSKLVVTPTVLPSKKNDTWFWRDAWQMYFQPKSVMHLTPGSQLPFPWSAISLRVEAIHTTKHTKHWTCHDSYITCMQYIPSSESWCWPTSNNISYNK